MAGDAPGLDLPPTSPVAQPTAPGAIVAPVGTATAAAAIINTATAQAAAPAQQPTYQPGECPAPGNPAPPARPAAFVQYPQVIAQYLSAGGAPTLLEATLRSWDAINDAGGLVKVDTDITGDGVNEVIITVLDPTHADRQPRPGQLLIFGCDNRGYRLLYASTADPAVSLPVFLRVGDMNGDARAEVVFQTQRCDQPTVCTGAAQILSWDAILGSFQPLNAGLVSAPNAQFSVVDVDGDGILELTVTGGGATGAATGPTRTTAQIWDWDGQSYLLAVVETAAPVYRIHALHDGDAALAAGNYPDARAAYERVLNDEALLPWTLPNERAYLNACALYRLVLTHALRRDTGQAQAAFDRLTQQYPPGTPGDAFTTIALAFWNDYASSRNAGSACAQARNAAATRPDALSILNSYGTANRQYSVTDLCPY
ncbi:MAG: tetratricopeptide repeat protein [Anaerolineae bacterium]|nr:tetratricopeptide repeat protein [Anaerolineae bacterium]